jgi:hypothetical protein
MTTAPIDTSHMPLQTRTLLAQAFLQSFPASPALATSAPVPTSSLRSSEAKILPAAPSLDLQLFDNAAELKIKFSRIAMHLPSQWRTTIFEQLDQLLGRDHWEEDSSSLIQPATFFTFLRFVIYTAPNRLPSLGVAPTGHLLAAWIKGDQRITIQFLPDDHAIATLTHEGTRGQETVVWHGHVVDLRSFIDRFGMAACMYEDSESAKKED